MILCKVLEEGELSSFVREGETEAQRAWHEFCTLFRGLPLDSRCPQAHFPGADSGSLLNHRS